MRPRKGTMNQSISTVVLTKNEEKNIERCIATLAWCDEIIIIDDYSDDDTISRIKNYESRIKEKNIKIFKRKLNGDFAAQRNFGLEKASGDWILFVDADEVVTTKLGAEIKQQISDAVVIPVNEPGSTEKEKWIPGQARNDNRVAGFFLKRKDYFGGNWLNYGETANVRFLRLGRKEMGKWEGRVHEVWKLEGEFGELINPVLHYPHPTVTEFLKEVNTYTDIVVQCWKEEGRKIKVWEIIVYPAGKFIRNYIIRLGFLDGVAGLIMAIFMSFHSFLARSKYRMLK